MDHDTLSYSEIIQAVSDQKVQKDILTKSVKQLEKQNVKGLEAAYAKIFALNQEQANKFFSQSESKISFSDRITQSVQNLQAEIKKLEGALDLPSCNDDEYFQSLTELETKENHLLNLLKQSESAKHSDQYATITDYMKETSSELLDQKFNSIALEKRHQQIQFNEMKEFESNYSDILERRDVDPNLTGQVIDRIRNKSAITVNLLENDAQTVTKELQTQRASDMADIDSKYGKLLNDFIVTNENVSESYLERYRETMLVTSQLLKTEEVQSLSDRKSNQSDSGAPNYSVSAVVGSDLPAWMSELEHRYHSILANGKKCELLEAEIDSLLMKQMSESQVDGASGDIDPSYLETLMSNLAALYTEMNEATLAVNSMS